MYIDIQKVDSIIMKKPEFKLCPSLIPLVTMTPNRIRIMPAILLGLTFLLKMSSIKGTNTILREATKAAEDADIVESPSFSKTELPQSIIASIRA
jgi:hypothetical protein